VTADVAGAPAKGTGVAPPDEPDAVSAVAFSASDFWQGTSLTVPGQGSQELLLRSPNYLSAPADGSTYQLVTRQNWAIGCLPGVQNASGEGFVAVSPQGVRYRFDWMAVRVQPNVKKSGGSLGRQEMFLMATLVTDRFGNWVRYSYDLANPLLLTRIESSDGRIITITNANGRASSASDGTRTFVYGYGSRGELSTVTQPDGSRWTFDLTPMVPANLPNLGESANCDSPGDFYADILTGRIVHPSGAEGVFTTQFWKFGRTYVNRVCWYAPGSTTVTTGAVWPRQVTSQALMVKQITGPGLATLRWSYAYNAPGGWSTCTTGTCILPRTVTVTEPTGDQTRHTFGSRWRVDEGQLQKVDEGWNAATGKALKTTTYRYRSASGQAYPEQFGTSPQQNSDWLASRNRPQDQRVISLQSSTFTWQADTTSAGFDVYARLRKATKSSSLGHTRTETTVYADSPAWWVMGQLASVTEQSTGRVVESHTYDAKAQRTASYRFGQLDQSFAYNADGTLASVSDAANQVTRLANHKRGKPQRVTHPDGASESQVINNLGNADSRTNAVGGTTQFGYDAMGRVSLVVPPAGDAVAYHPTYQTFEQVGALELGLQPGHWRQTISTGNARTVRYFDAMWRERLEARYDTTRRRRPAVSRKPGTTPTDASPSRVIPSGPSPSSTRRGLAGRPGTTRSTGRSGRWPAANGGTSSR
jgi:YD repeat-containing protein